VTLPQLKLRQQLRVLLFSVGSIGLIAFVLVIGYRLIYAGLDGMLTPLEKLPVVITRLGKGDFKQRSRDAVRTDEIAQLAAAFNRIADQLEKMMNENRSLSISWN